MYLIPDELYYGGLEARVPNFVKSKRSKEEAPAPVRDPRELRGGGDPRLPVDPREMRGYLPPPPHHPQQQQQHGTLQHGPPMWQQRGGYDHGMGEFLLLRPTANEGSQVTGLSDQTFGVYERSQVTGPSDQILGVNERSQVTGPSDQTLGGNERSQVTGPSDRTSKIKRGHLLT